MVDELLQQDMLIFTPLTGTFDTAAVAERIGALGFSFQDEIEPAMFVVSPDEESRDIFRERRRSDGESGFPRVLLVEVKPERISIWPSSLESVWPLSRELIGYLIGATPCRIESEFGENLTALAA